MSNQQWKSKWKRDDIAFHQSEFNPLLSLFWPTLGLVRGDTVLVPLCGKSLDMNWLLEKGYKVIGIELSNIAIQAFFAGRGVTPSRKRHGRFIRWSQGDVEIWCGDLFDLSLDDLKEINALYDCAALTALPAEVRAQYVRHLGGLLPDSTPILLMTTESAEETEDIKILPYEIDGEVASLYQSQYRVELLHGQQCLKIDPEYPYEPASMLEEKVYRMTPH
jgi:thiopurine S-methyltransferase